MAAPIPVTKSVVAGEVGDIEIATQTPVDVAPRAIAVVAHPHPLFGGTMDNKVVTTLARAMLDAGAITTRFNFRGIGKTAGTHDHGRGETADMLAVIAALRAANPGLPLWLAGFSFGGAVTLAASEALDELGVEINEMILVAPGFARMEHWANVASGGKPPAQTLLIHGELDDTVPLASSLDWARGRDIAVTVIPDAEHFFHQRLHILKRLVQRHLSASESAP
jgi:uncharacterized protein